MKFVIENEPRYGIGNKLHVLIGEFRLASEYYNMDFVILWENDMQHFSFSELFDDSEFTIINRSQLNDEYFVPSTCQDLKRNKHIQIVKKGDIVRAFEFGFPMLNNEDELIKDIFTYKNKKNTLAYMYDRTPKTIKESYLKYFNMLKPCKNIQIVLDNFVSEKFSGNILGVHIRLGDKITKNKLKISEIQKYYPFVDHEISQNKYDKIFVSCDEQIGYDLMTQRYENKVIRYDHDYDKDQKDDKVALICILLLSKCDKLMCVVGSTFSEMAWWFGGCKDILVINHQVF